MSAHTAPPRPPKLLDQVRQVMRLKHMSPRTEKSYIYYIKRAILHHGKRHPREMGVVEIRDFLSSLVVEGKVTASTQNVARAAILFLYKEVLQIDLPYIDGIVHARRPKRLPVVFSRQEVKKSEVDGFVKTRK